MPLKKSYVVSFVLTKNNAAKKMHKNFSDAYEYIFTIKTSKKF